MTDTIALDEAEHIVAQVLDAYRSAWDAGDADAFGSLFAERATYVIFLGEALMGREAITENHRGIFTRWQAGKKLRVKPVAVQVLGADVISVLTVGGIGADPREIEIDKFQTFTLHRAAEGWMISAFHNTAMSHRVKPGYNE